MLPIPGFENRYSVTSDGQVYSHRRMDARNRIKWGIFLKQKKNLNGRLTVKLFDANLKEHHIMVHRLVGKVFLGVKDRSPIDHIDGNPHNNRLENLRACTASQNQGNRKISSNNTSGFKGVCFQKKIGKWQASCRINGTRKHGWFETKEGAARFYDSVAIEAHGEFAKLNFPRG